MAFSLKGLFSSSVEAVSTPDRVVGIDVGRSSVKVVEVENTERALMLKTYGELQLGPYAEKALGETAVLTQEQHITAIVDVIREAGVEATHGILSIPLTSSFLTAAPVPHITEEGFESQIMAEAKKYIPLPLADVALDWTELAKIENSDGSMRQVTEVLIAAVEHETIQSYKTIAEAIKMGSSPSEIEAFSLVRALSTPDDTTVSIIDLGAYTAKLYLVRDGMIERVHRVPAGGAKITAKIAEQQGISFAEAEELKRSGQAPELTSITQSVLTPPLGQFKRLLTQYESRNGGAVDRILLSGGVVTSPQVPQIVADTMGREVALGNGFDKVAYPAFMEDTLREIAPIFGVSLGAAFRPYTG